MKPAFESLSSFRHQSFLVRKFGEECFAAPFHFHPEYELTFILSGSGKRYIGANMNDFYPGRFCIGGQQSASLLEDGAGYKAGTAGLCSGTIFKKEFLGSEFFSKPEMTTVLQMLQKSSNGLHFTGNIEGYKKKMLQLYEEKNSFKKIISFLDLLHQLSLTKNFTLIEKQQSQTSFSPAEQQRIHIAMAYIVENFKSEISLTGAAAAVNMAPQSFCKYFKKLTRKTFMEAVTDYRIDYAAQQLIHTNNSISQIGFDSGFNDISNFHKTFKNRMQLSPLSYRNTFLQKLSS